MTRILFWCDAFWPLIGGVEVLAAKIAVALQARGYELCVVTRHEPNLRVEDAFHGIPIHRLPFLQAMVGGDVERWVDVRRQVVALKQSFRPDVVHVYHANFDVLFHVITSAAHPAPTLCTVHGAFLEEAVRSNTAVAQMLRSADWVAACSGAALAQTRRQVPEITPRSSVIWNGLEAPLVAPTSLPVEEPRLLCVGRLGTVEEKGFDLALAALPAILQRFPRTRLRIAGDGPARPELERCASTLGVAGSVDFLGWEAPAKVMSLINEATVLLMPSRVAEGFGLVALQAAQMARPVVATRVGGVPEVVVDGETGLLVESEDVAGLAQAVASLLADPVRATRMGRAGRLRATTHFGWERHVDAYDELLQRLAHGASREMSTA